MVEFAEPRIIRPATARDADALKAAFPDNAARQAERIERQTTGEETYLLAVQNEIPVGHLLIKWNGAPDEAIIAGLAAAMPGVVIPDLEDLFVAPEHRHRRVGSRLLEAAEQMAKTRGFTRVGLSASAENADGRALYAERGYTDSGIAPFTLRGEVTNADGVKAEWVQPDCSYFVRALDAAADTTVEKAEKTTTDTAAPLMENNEPGTGTPAEKPSPFSAKPITDQVVDFAFGVALTAVERLEQGIQQAPAVWDAMQEKGRPARERLVQSLREETREETEAAVSKSAPADTLPGTLPGDDTGNETSGTAGTPPFPAGGVGGSPAPVPEAVAKTPVTPAAELPPLKPAARPFGWGFGGGTSAEDEIRALEDRVKTLEKEVVIAPPAAPPIVAASPSAPTPAEMGTTPIDFTPATRTADALTDSPYAVTDDEERAALPAQTGELQAVPPTGETPEAVAALVDGAVPGNEFETEPVLAPLKGKRARKTTSDASAGTDAADEPSIEELEG